MAKPGPARAFSTEPYSYTEARALADELDLSEPVAITLVRRGYRTVEEARSFLEAAETHDPFAFSSMEEICGRLLKAMRDGRRITVHGDYDVDGVSSTSILVRLFRDLGAECDWYLPDRLGDGYGLSTATVERLAAAGTGLLLTADCGIGCAAEVSRAQELGLEMIVTDHHSPPAELPDCPILHPVVSGYPFTELCATGVAYKLSVALRERAGADPTQADGDLDLVALATVADLVPLRGENRSLVRRGLAALRRAQRPGLRALMAASRIEPSRLDEGDLAFRLGPRINAVGRLYRADAGVELMLTDDEHRAEQIAAELDRANHERRDTEREVDQAAEAARGALPKELTEMPALVIGGQGWHPGVVGIVASRLVERHGVPVVLISFEGDKGRGSGRSIPGFDLLGGLEACAEHLTRFGGHRAAAGLEIEASRFEAFRDAFLAHAAENLNPGDLVRNEHVDAVVSGGELGHDLAEQIARLGPFGMGNPGVRLLVPSARVGDVRPMGEGKHARFSISSGGGEALGVAFGGGPTVPLGEDESADLTVRLELNHWNGAVEPRVVLGQVYPLGEVNGSADGCARCAETVGSDKWWDRVETEMARDLEPEAYDLRPTTYDLASNSRTVVGHPPGSAIAAIGELTSSGAPVLALCADASRRRALVDHAAEPGRFGAGVATIVCGRCPDDELLHDIEAARDASGLVLTDYSALARHPHLLAGFEHVVLVDPPPSAALDGLVGRGGDADRPGFLHVTWGEVEREFAAKVHGAEWETRQALVSVYRDLVEAGGAEDAVLAALLAGTGKHPRSPELAGRCLRVLEELQLVELGTSGRVRTARVVSSEGTDLERSEAFVAYRARHEEGIQFLSKQRRPE